MANISAQPECAPAENSPASIQTQISARFWRAKNAGLTDEQATVAALGALGVFVTTIKSLGGGK